MDFIIQFLPPALDISKNIETGWSIKDWLPIIASGVTITTLITTLVINNKYQNTRQSELINAQKELQVTTINEQKAQQESTFREQQAQQERLLAKQKAEFFAKSRQEWISKICELFGDFLSENQIFMNIIGDIPTYQSQLYRDQKYDLSDHLIYLEQANEQYKKIYKIIVQVDLYLEDNDELIKMLISEMYSCSNLIFNTMEKIDLNLDYTNIHSQIEEEFIRSNLVQKIGNITNIFKTILSKEREKIRTYGW